MPGKPVNGRNRIGLPNSKIGSLSKRESEILTWSARGKTNPEISIMLAISEDTVKDHLERLGRKFNTTNKTHAVAFALSHGLIKL